MAKPYKRGDKWQIKWIDEHGIRRSETFSSEEDAKFKLRQHQLEVEQVKRGLIAPRSTEDKIFDDICVYWLTKRTAHKRSGDSDESMIRVHLRPAFGKKKLREISVEDIDNYKLSKSAISPKTLGNQLTLLTTMLNVAVDLRWISEKPRFRKPKFSLIDKDYRFLRTREEIDRFLAAAREEGEHIWIFYLTAISTGGRAGEIAGLERADIDFEQRVITFQRSFYGPTKSGEIRRVPIQDTLLRPLQEWVIKQPSKLVFTNERGGMHGESSRIFQEILQRVLKRAGFPQTVSGSKVRHYIRFHDLRHTFASHWMMNGGSKYKLQKILGHQSEAMTERYAHCDPQSFREDFGRIRIHSTPSSDVIPLLAAQK